MDNHEMLPNMFKNPDRPSYCSKEDPCRDCQTCHNEEQCDEDTCEFCIEMRKEMDEVRFDIDCSQGRYYAGF